jgi:hypothetical protein
LFDRQTKPFAAITDKLPARWQRHIADIITVDVSSAPQWATGGSSGGEAGRFDVEGNGLILLPSYMRARDKTTVHSGTGQHGFGGSAQLYIFFNCKDTPGLPFSINSESNFGDFISVCCTFNRLYIYVATPQNIPGPKVLLLAILRGLDLSGCGSNTKSSAAEIVGAYGAGREWEA